MNSLDEFYKELEAIKEYSDLTPEIKDGFIRILGDIPNPIPPTERAEFEPDEIGVCFCPLTFYHYCKTGCVVNNAHASYLQYLNYCTRMDIIQAADNPYICNDDIRNNLLKSLNIC